MQEFDFGAVKFSVFISELHVLIMRTAYWGKKSYRKCFQQETAMSCQFNIQHGTFCKKRRKLCFVILIHFTMNLDWDKLVIL
jgi:hypothetical protein